MSNRNCLPKLNNLAWEKPVRQRRNMADPSWQGRHQERSVPAYSREFWQCRADEFSEYAATTGYAEQFIALMKVHPDWSVLDMGCGGGTLSVPLAPMVRTITAVDFSTNMLDIVQRRCKAKGIENVRTINCSWEDDWDGAGIGVHDIAIASRSLMGDDFKALITKLSNAARRAVYISMMVGSGPFDKPLFESTGRTFDMGKDYIFYYDLLHEMGIWANVAFCREDHASIWGSHEEALDDQRWMFHCLTKDEEDRVRTYLQKNLKETNGRFALPYDRICYWAVMWWNKEMENRR
jgi:SAM-dependent methyltransferase